MPFLDELRNIQNKTNTSQTQTDLIFNEILLRSGLLNQSADYQYAHLDDIIAARNNVSVDIANAGLKEDVSIIGSITEQICRIGLEAAAPGRYHKLPKDWKWMGDFALTGIPFNLFISVKSYYARERLIVSGTGQGAAPVIGYGLFTDSSEWNPNRVKQYLHRGFVAIYMPHNLYSYLAGITGTGHPVTNIKNIYGNPFLRDISNFSDNIRTLIRPDFILNLELF